MRYSYSIKLDINEDAWNWYDASQNSFQGFDWVDNIDNEEDKNLFNKILKLDEKQAKKQLKIYLKQKYINQTEEISRYIDDISDRFKQKFNKACETIEKITGKEIFVKELVFILTTFPRCPYFQDSGKIFFYITSDKYWVDPVEHFMHELLHFQFHHYWQENPTSQVSKLSEDEFDFINESLAVVLDESLIPLIDVADFSYPIHKEFREELHKEWVRHHDFDKLVDFGLKELNKYTTA